MKYKLLVLVGALTLTNITPTLATPLHTIHKVNLSQTHTLNVTATSTTVNVVDDITLTITSTAPSKFFKVRDMDTKAIIPATVLDNGDNTYKVTISDVQRIAKKDTPLKLEIVEANSNGDLQLSEPKGAITITVNPIVFDAANSNVTELKYGKPAEHIFTYQTPETGTWYIKYNFEPSAQYPNVGQTASNYLSTKPEVLPGSNAVDGFEDWFSFSPDVYNKFKIVKSSLRDLGYSTSSISTTLDIRQKEENTINLMNYLPALSNSQSYGSISISDLRSSGMSTNNLYNNGSSVTFTVDKADATTPTITGKITTSNITDIPFTLKLNITNRTKIKPVISIPEMKVNTGTKVGDLSVNYTAKDNNGSSISGTFEITDDKSKVLSKGSHNINYKFTPSSQSEYEVVTGSFKVTAETPEITKDSDPTLKEVIVGESLSNIQFDSTGKYKAGSTDVSKDVKVSWKYPNDKLEFNKEQYILVKYQDNEKTFSFKPFNTNINKFTLLNCSKNKVYVDVSETKTSDRSISDNKYSVKGNVKIDFPGPAELIGNNLTFDEKGNVTFDKDTNVSLRTKDGKGIDKVKAGDKVDCEGNYIPVNGGTTTVTETSTETTTADVNTPKKPHLTISNNKQPLTDIDKSWAKDYIDFLYQRDIISGSNGKFYPRKPITRADISILLHKTITAYSVPTSLSHTKKFTDLDETQYYYNYLQSMADSGIISGYPDGTIKPNKNITREEAAVLVYNTLNHIGLITDQDKSMTPLEFRDDSKISSWAKEAINVLTNKGILSGDNGYFYPQKNITREEVATILYMVVNN